MTLSFTAAAPFEDLLITKVIHQRRLLQEKMSPALVLLKALDVNQMKLLASYMCIYRIFPGVTGDIPYRILTLKNYASDHWTFQ